MSVRRRTHSDDFAYISEKTRRPSKLNVVQEHRLSQSPQGYSLKTVIIVSIVVSIFCQHILPNTFVYLNNLIKNAPKRKSYQSDSNRLNIEFISTDKSVKYSPAVQKPTFLVDPINDEKWKGINTAVPVMTTESEEKRENDHAKVKEAILAAKAASRSRRDGNLEKAMTIMEHAMALAPNNPHILIEMGQIREMHNELVEADQCYVKALAYDPGNSEALILRARTNPLVSAIDRKMLRAVHDLRNEFAHLQHSTALRRMMRETYFLYVYHTVAIEGNTLSLGQTRAILESGMVIPGKSIREHNEVIGMDAALRFLNCSLLSKEHEEISIDDILEMHRRVLGNADPIEAGRIRTTQVYVGRFTPVSPEYVMEQLADMVDWLNDESTLAMDPIERAAIAHYKLVLVHPFTDGNGRTARLLLNLIMMRSGFPPVILPVETRAEYYASLHTANLGDLRPFVRYVAKHSEASIQRYIGAMKTSSDNVINGGNSEMTPEESEVSEKIEAECKAGN
uniref:Protein adenylyltransferase fic-1 n=1 Tax=Caenorhabditis tropicalis TaxID=1561998 RepID=A0A1I7UCN3_9PELO